MQINNTTYTKDARRDPKSRDWIASVYVGTSHVVILGAFDWPHEAQSACDDYVYQSLMRQPVVMVEEAN
jgi:hypothetical protein